MYTHKQVHKFMHILYSPIHIKSHTHVQHKTQAYTHSIPHSHARPHMHLHKQNSSTLCIIIGIQTYTHMHSQVCMHTYSRIHVHTRVCVYMHMHEGIPTHPPHTLFFLPFPYTFPFAPIYSFPPSSSTFPILRPSWYCSELLWIWYLWRQDPDLFIHKVNEPSHAHNVKLS